MTLEKTSTENDPRWSAVLNRTDPADVSFVYAVRTTGIFCRPSCPSRRARRENVSFYDSATAAEAAGYRPCRRCHPAAKSPAKFKASIVAAACRLIETSEESPKLRDLAASIGLSPYYFHRLFKAATGLTPRSYSAAHRSKNLRAGLRSPGASVTQAIYGAGFNAGSRFYEQADSVLGMTPTAFKRGGDGAAIYFAVGQCSLGAILVARSDKGVCAITLNDDPEFLVRDLQDRFPKADLIGGDEAFEALVARVVGFVEAPGIGLDLPLDVRGTAFQQRVWQALRELPAGATVSYAELARRIGQPKAVRAVAKACGANTLAVAIPCHRVVRHDGALSGYRWGVDRKRALLDREARG